MRTQELFEFEYVLEMYKPQAQRRWGYFALPVLSEDRLVGKLDAKSDRKDRILQVHARAESQVLAGGAVGIFFAGSFVLVVYIDDD